MSHCSLGNRWFSKPRLSRNTWHYVGDLDQSLFYSQDAATGKEVLDPGGWFGCAWTHGVTGGAISAIEGQSFKDGFLSAAVASVMSGPIDGIGNIGSSMDAETIATIAARGAAAGLIGGTVAASMGGNFENAAWTAAYAEMFNDCEHEQMNSQLVAIRNQLTTNPQKGLNALHNFVEEHGSVVITFKAGYFYASDFEIIATTKGFRYFFGGGLGFGVSGSAQINATVGGEATGVTARTTISVSLPGVPVVMGVSSSASFNGISGSAFAGSPGEGEIVETVVGYTTKLHPW